MNFRPSIRSINFVVFTAIGLFLICFDLFKASHASFTHDESYTYLHYVSLGVMDIVSYRDPSTNNHILNTLLMKTAEPIFGNSELALRLPNILAHILFLIFTFKIFSRYTPKNCILFFVLINANPFLIDFFSLARGYGLAIGLMSASFYYFCRYLENKQQRYQVFSMLFIGLACLANFTLLHVFVILIIAQNIFLFLIFKYQITWQNVRKVNSANLMITALFSIIFYEPIRKIITHKLIDFGGVEGIWEDTVRSQIYSFVYFASYDVILTIVLKIFIVLGSILFIWRAASYFSNRSPNSTIQNIALFLGMILFLTVFDSMAQHMLLGTPFPGGRVAVFICPIFILMCSFLFEDLWNVRYKFLTRGFIFLITGIFFLHTCNVLNASWYYEWPYERNTKKMLTDLTRERQNMEAKISLGITWLYEPTINFYIKTLNLDWLNKVDRNGLSPENDYYYLTLEELMTVPFKYDFARSYFTTKSFLVKPKKEIIYLKGAGGKYVFVDEMNNNRILVGGDNSSSPKLFTLLQLKNGKYAIYSYTHKYLSAELGQHNEITATRDKIGEWETFSMTRIDSNHVAFKAANGKYFSADSKSSQSFAIRETIGENEKFEMIIK